MISTAEDMAHYMIVLINGGTFRQKTLLSPEAIQVMHTPHQVFRVIMPRDGQHKKKTATSLFGTMVQ
jgi:CubicO group peptidase (beta-lactamase class C family)